MSNQEERFSEINDLVNSFVDDLNEKIPSDKAELMVFNAYLCQRLAHRTDDPDLYIEMLGAIIEGMRDGKPLFPAND